MCGLDALHTSIMNMISDDDWLRIMAALRLTKPPALCRRNSIPSWCLGAQFDAAPAATVIDLALSGMRPSPRFGAALMAWARRIEGAFPDLATKTQQHLARRSERDLQARHEELSHRAVSPVTREFLSTSSESRSSVFRGTPTICSRTTPKPSAHCPPHTPSECQSRDSGCSPPPSQSLVASQIS